MVASKVKVTKSEAPVSSIVFYVSSRCTNSFTAEANLRVLCYGVVFFSVVGIIGRVLGLISDDSNSETPEKELLPLPGFLGKSVVEASNAVATNHEEGKEIRGTRPNRVVIQNQMEYQHKE